MKAGLVPLALLLVAAGPPPTPGLPDGLLELPGLELDSGGAFTVSKPPGTRAFRKGGEDREHALLIRLPSGGLVAVLDAAGDAEFGEDVPCRAALAPTSSVAAERGTTTLAGRPACTLTIRTPVVDRIVVEQAQPGNTGRLFTLFLTTPVPAFAKDAAVFAAVVASFKAKP